MKVAEYIIDVFGPILGDSDLGNLMRGLEISFLNKYLMCFWLK